MVTKKEFGSPCVGVCAIYAESGLCAGCFRTVDEMARWDRFDREQKRTILAEIQNRRRSAEIQEIVMHCPG